MGRGLSYADAVRLLGGQDSKVVAVLDRLCGGLLLAVSAGGGGFALSLLGARSELARLSGDLVSGLGERLRGLTRFSRSERLVAAHAVVVLAAYFDSLDQIDLPFAVRELGLSKAEQAALATGEISGSERTRALAAALLRADVPAPAPQWPFELTLGALREFYVHLSDEVTRFVADLTVWDRLDETQRSCARHMLVEQLPDHALARYEEAYRRLAASFPEFAFWSNQVDHQATRAQLGRVSQGLAGLEQMLAAFAAGRAPTEHRMALARVYRAALGEPVLTSGDGSPGLRIPLLGEGYVNPDFRVAQVDMADQLAVESWWSEHPVRDDLPGFLVGYFTAPQATSAPLLILGQPGSGKSVLTKVLAARLPLSEFLVVRVALRDVPADADVQTQIEHAIRSAIGEDLRWPQLGRSAGDALPVVLLDGFDELLQATGVTHSDYLEKVADFQHREADLGRPVAVVVTSRTTLADRTRSVWGMAAIRLEPFRDAQVLRWLWVWNSANAAQLAARGLNPLPAKQVLAHSELAAQPLLLLMLALYDADDNALQHDEDTPLGHAELYERLLILFAEREVRKIGAALPGEDFSRALEWELTRLSVTAFAMFNRNRQWVTEAELDADLFALLDDPVEQRFTVGLRAELTAAQVVIGRFFFVHEARASRDDGRLKTYEFLHATFGEYLIGRLVVRELIELVKAAELGIARSRPSAIDDAFLHALLSFAALATRGTTVSFLAEQLTTLLEHQRRRLRGLLLELFHHALESRHDTNYSRYQPARLTVPARHAAYSANLTLLIVLVYGEVTEQELFPGCLDAVSEWQRITFLWRSQLSSEGWNRLVHTIAVCREWDGDRRIIRLKPADGKNTAPSVDPYWSYNIKPCQRTQGAYQRWRHYSYDDLRLHSHFTCDRIDDTIMHALEPFSDSLDPAIGTILGLSEGHALSPAHALVTLLLTVGHDVAEDTLLSAYKTCLIAAFRGFSDSAIDTQERYCELVFRQLATDCERLPAEWVRDTLKQIEEAGQRNPALRRLATHILPKLQ
jgi:hypothetical protein